ncbi:MAG: hypothetical protein JSR27_04370 [Proteobacteria bacterium]|nr:hypothetical protein [Pseudomonadota bacterium]
MKINRYLIASVASTLAVSARAQPTPPALNLNLPANSAAAASPPPTLARVADKSTLAAITTTAATMPALQNPPPAGAGYDANANAVVDAADSRGVATCDDGAHSQPQVHGTIGMGVVAGNHVSGNYQTGSVSMTKALGSCDHPSGMVGLSIRVGRGRFNGRNYGPGRW